MTNSVSSQSLQRKRPIQQQQQQQQQSRTRSHSVTSIQRRRRNNSHYWCSIVLLILGCSVQANDSNNTFFDRFGDTSNLSMAGGTSSGTTLVLYDIGRVYRLSIIVPTQWTQLYGGGRYDNDARRELDETNIPTAAPVYAPPVAPNTANDYITPVSIPSFTPSIATIDTGYEPAPSPLHVMTLEPDAACS
eukprot:CAMPEP_0178919382 /NCGR_PEP_ID=MMETSP0786-20121207/14404_1 /TAXON_ID=186022 /ORGANISM="Thalassionema frauenfeldii, Strain CCMP 1798" /LENGTH=189 /DNA_ID=CAMNT_0020593303 /DNA_START=98 /DNA_END=664 /DNA_ORIENTATION=+